MLFRIVGWEELAMKTIALLAAILFATSVFAQTQTVVVTELGTGMYSLSSSEGLQTVNVVPLGGGIYSFYSTNGENAMVTSIAPGMYTVRSANDVMGTAYVYSLGNGRYSFSNPTTGTNGTIQSTPTATAIPLPALAVQQGQNNMASLYLLAMMLRQQCYAQGGVLYKAHWYSAMRCVSREQAQAEENAKIQKKQLKNVR
jgi:hypothetical protein